MPGLMAGAATTLDSLDVSRMAVEDDPPDDEATDALSGFEAGSLRAARPAPDSPVADFNPCPASEPCAPLPAPNEATPVHTSALGSAIKPRRSANSVLPGVMKARKAR